MAQQKPRKELEIIYDVIKNIQKNNNIAPTKIMKIARINHTKFKKIINKLSVNNLILKKKKYEITKRGEEYITEYELLLKYERNNELCRLERHEK